MLLDPITHHSFCFRNIFSSHSHPFFVVFYFTDFHASCLSHLQSMVHIHLESFCQSQSVPIHRLISSSKKNSKTKTVSTSSQTNKTVGNSNVDTLKVATFRTLAMKLANELNADNISPNTRRASFKIKYNNFLLSTKTILCEHYYRLHASGPKIAIYGTTSSNVFIIDETSFEKVNLYFLHALHEALDSFNNVLQDFGFSQTLEHYNPQKHPDQTVSNHPFYNIR